MASTPQASTSQTSTGQNTPSVPVSEPQSTYAAFTIPADASVTSGNDDFFGSVPSTSGFQQPQMSADLTNDMSWAGFDWSSLAGMDNAQPALTYASSNTISEFGEHTPPDDYGTMFANHNIPGKLNETSAQLAQIPETQASFQPLPHRTVDNQQNRWSLPPSFWAASGSNALNFTQAFPTNNMGMDSSKNVQEMPSEDFSFNNWVDNTFVPNNNAAQQNFTDNNQTQWSPDMSNQQVFDFQAMGGSTDGSTNAFDFGSDTMNATYRQTPEDPFFGVDTTEPLDFNQDFSQTDIPRTWPS
ncbi:hypothetical protein C1H76_9262 [Elsinoe australis]|uniref:Uncharacterized protein n=1 Tax=Elsinoe australis TaxID=40998 RepID=A0A4U7AKI7_9PEZI|nr:hypothetical protein C1H76_9262 [Elsinoe australis]